MVKPRLTKYLWMKPRLTHIITSERGLRFYFYDDKMEDTRKNWSKRIDDEGKNGGYQEELIQDNDDASKSKEEDEEEMLNWSKKYSFYV